MVNARDHKLDAASCWERPRLAGLKILAEITGQARNRRFRYEAYVRLFDEGPQA